ncbi:MAG: flagellar biosynthesis protein FlgA [Alphaproteobacteria bacterium]|nr:flagellar biosynthesis protein FlgA [Alphaproteobacteria bacterium]
MNLYALLNKRAAAGKPVRVGLIGAGKFGSMFLAQALTTPGMHIAAIADLKRDRAAASLTRVGWKPEQFAASSLADAVARGTTWLTEDSMTMIAGDGIEVIIDATGSPPAGIAHARAAFASGKHVVMVNVEADALVGPMLAREAEKAGVVYSLAYGDQPALIAEMVDWARASGFEVTAAGKGTKYLPIYHGSTPESVWQHYGFSREQVASGELNAQMFNSFIDGTKSAIEMTAVANATGLSAPSDGLLFPPCGVDDLAHVLRPKSHGGVLEGKGKVEVISSLERDGRPVFRDLRWGVYVVFEGATGYVRDCFKQYGLVTDGTGRYTAMYKPYHLIGLELGISVASAALRREPTGVATGFRADAVATAKRDLAAGEVLDGEGGYTVWGKCLPAERSLSEGALPIGLAHGLKLKRAVKAGSVVGWADVATENASGLMAEAIRARRQMEETARTERGTARAAQ